MRKNKNNKIWRENDNKNKTTRCKQENHLVLLQKKKADNTDIKTIQLHCLERKQTAPEKYKNKSKNIKHKHKLPFNQHNTKKL